MLTRFMQQIRTFVWPEEIPGNSLPAAPEYRSRYILIDIPEGASLTVNPEQTALEIGRRIHAALGNKRIEAIDRLELYVSRKSSLDLEDLLPSVSDTASLLWTIEEQVFGGGQHGGPQGGKKSPFSFSQIPDPVDREHRVVFHKRGLVFHPVFDGLLDGKIIVRPLGEDHVPVFVDPTEAVMSDGQLLIGLIQIFDKEGKCVGDAPIWYWRSPRVERRLVIDLDFDVMAKAFEPRLHRFPLGLEIHCTLAETGESRRLDEVSLRITELRRWASHAAGRVKYYADSGDDRALRHNDLSLYPSPVIDIPPESSPLGQFDIGAAETLAIDRIQGLVVETPDESWRYQLGFFRNVPRYDPSQNVLRVAAQLLPVGNEVVVALPPGEQADAEPICRLLLTGKDDSRCLHLWALPRLLYSLRFNGTDLSDRPEGHVFTLGKGDPGTLEVRRNSAQHRRADPLARSTDPDFVFSLRDWDALIPVDVLWAAQQQKRPYGAALMITAPGDRRYRLAQRRHVFGRGRSRGFPEDAAGIESTALIIERQYVYLRVSPGRDQRLWFVDRQTAKAQELPRDGHRLGLNGTYEIYVGDYQVLVDLHATPRTQY